MKHNLNFWWRKFHEKYLFKNKLLFVGWFFERSKNKYCWTECVSYAYDPFRINPYNIETASGCQKESETHSTEMCYCGQWLKGKCWSMLTKEEHDAFHNRIEVNSRIEPVLPF